MTGPGAALLGTLVLLAPGSTRADSSIGGIALGESIAAIVPSRGQPNSVASLDAGNRFAFADGTTAYVDDDGRVLAVETQMGRPRIDIDGTPRTFPIGSYRLAQADADLADVAEFATATLRSYRLAPRRDLVLTFGTTSARLERVVYGEPGQLARLGYLPGDPAAKAIAYRAPQLRGRAEAPSLGEPPPAMVYRLAIDRGGAVSRVEIVVASAQPAADEVRALQLRTDRYTPGTLGGRPIAATIFVRAHP